MSAASPTLAEPAAAAAPGSFAARLTEFLMVGGGTLVLFPLAWLLRRSLGPDPAEVAVDFLAFHAAFLINNPHFAVTYLIFYRDARRRALGDAFPPLQRARYIAAGFVVPLVLAGWASHAVATGSARTVGFLIQLMFFLVGWHYVKQGFGILTVLSARRGFRFSPLERAAVLGHCFAGWAYAWASPADPGRELQEKGVVYTSLAHPAGLERLTQILFAASAAALALVLARKWHREKQLPPLAPLTGFLVSIWLWTVYSSLDRLMMYVIPALHSLQYLYVVWLLKRNQARAGEGPPAFGKPASVQLGVLALSAIALGWVLFRGAPSFLDGTLVLGATPGSRAAGLGETPYFAAIYVFVNLHHYFMDHAIWRRENPDTRYLREA